MSEQFVAALSLDLSKISIGVLTFCQVISHIKLVLELTETRGRLLHPCTGLAKATHSHSH